MNLNELTLPKLVAGVDNRIKSGDYTAFITINSLNKIHVTLWKEFEQNDGVMNNCIIYIDFYSHSVEGLNEAKKDLLKYIN